MVFIAAFIIILLIILFYKRTQPPVDKRQKLILILLRSITIIILIILLLNPIIYFNQQKTIKPKFLILDDNSTSMDLMIDNIPKSETMNAVEAEIKTNLKSTNYETISYEFAHGLKGNSNTTLLSKTLMDIAKQKDLDNVKSIFLVSDGWFKDEDLSFLDNYLIPINVYLPGFKRTMSDLEISSIKYNKKAYKNETFPIITNVYAKNFQKKAKVELRVRGKTVSIKEINFTQNKLNQVVFEPIFQETGLIPFEIEVFSDSLMEADTSNNSFPGAVQAVENRMKILLIGDHLSWDAKFIKDVIITNPRWESKFLLWDEKLYEADQATELTDHLDDTIIIILFNKGELQLSEENASLISNFVNEGGGLILFGLNISSLANLFPTETINTYLDKDEIIYFTSLSRNYQIFNRIDNNSERNIPPVNYFYTNTDLQAKILARIENEEQSPAIVLSDSNPGKVLHFCFFNLWKWQLWQADNAYSDFVNDLLMWMGQNNTDRFYAYTTRNIYFQGEDIKIILQAYDETLTPVRNINARLLVKDNKGNMVIEKYMISGDDEYLAILENLEAGKYNYEITNELTGQKTTGEFIVNLASNENRDHGFNEPMLKFVAAKTGGIVFDKDSLTDFNLPNANSRKKLLQLELPLYKKLYFILLFLICFCLELYLRKRWGLL